MRILAVGGGSGGHVTPVLAVINELHKKDASLTVQFICDRKFAQQAQGIMSQASVPIETKTIFAGKLRRYHGVSLTRQLMDIPTVFHNLIDLFLISAGFFQSIYYLKKWRPEVIFTKGGFVCLPVGMAAALLRIPLVIHDSDAHPGLTNRILSRWAKKIATGAPLENYTYDPEKTFYVGIPVGESYQPVTKETQRQAKADVGVIDLNLPLIVVTGGGLGARRVNNAAIAIANSLTKKASIIHVSGQGEYEKVMSKAPNHPHYQVMPFAYNMPQILTAADIIIARAGMTTLSELAGLAKPTIIIPNGMLSGGHQLKNAKVYTEAGAAIALDEKLIENNPSLLYDEIVELIDDEKLRSTIGQKMHSFAKPHAASDTAQLIIDVLRTQAKQ